jgi:hypothetical protein
MEVLLSVLAGVVADWLTARLLQSLEDRRTQMNRKRFNPDRTWKGISYKRLRRIRDLRVSDADRADGAGRKHCRSDCKVTRLPD